MNIELLTIFVILNIVNVIIQTVKSICTVKCGKTAAAIVNAVAYGLYTYVIIYTVCDLPTWLKALVVAVANLIGVFVVKWMEEKARKQRLWKVEMTVPTKHVSVLNGELNLLSIPHSYINVGANTVFNVYCATQKESALVHSLVERFNAKYFISESKSF